MVADCWGNSGACTTDKGVWAGHAGSMTVARELSRRPATGRARGGGLSRLLVWGLGWMGRSARTMRESLRLLGFALCEFAVALRALLCILYSAMGIEGLDDAFTWLRVDSDRQRRWASRTGQLQLDADYRPLSPVTTAR